MEDRVEIPIVTTADTKGAQQTAAALRDVQNATQSHGEAAQEAGKKAEFLGLKHGELRKTVRELGREFPLAGAAARAMMNPIVAALTLAIGLFARAKSALDEWNAAMDAASKRAADPTFQAGIMAKKEAMHSAAIAQAEFLEGLRNIGAAEDGVVKKLEALINKWHDYAAAQAEVNNAAEAKELADVNLAEKLGKIKPEAAIGARAAIRQRFLKAADDLKTQAENNELAAKQAELTQATQAGPKLAAQQAASAQSAAAIGAKLRQQQADFEKLVGKGGTVTSPAEGSTLAQSRAQVEEMQTARDKAEFFVRKVMNVSEEESPTGGPLLVHTTANLEGAKRMADAQKVLALKLEKSINQISESELPGASSAAKVAAEKATANETRRRALLDETERMRASQTTLQGGRRIAEGLKSGQITDEQFEQLAGTDLGKMLSEGSQTAHVLLAGRAAQTAKQQGRPLKGGDEMIKAAQKLTDGQIGELNALQQYFQKQGQTSEQTLKLIEKATSDASTFKTRMDQLERKINSIDAKQKAVGTR